MKKKTNLQDNCWKSTGDSERYKLFLLSWEQRPALVESWLHDGVHHERAT